MGFTDSLKQGAMDLVGANQKAIIEIADFSETKVEKVDAKKPSAGNGGGFVSAKDSGFSLDSMKSYERSLLSGDALNAFDKGDMGNAFEEYTGFKKYRFECQFNPDEITITGYGGEELPIHNYSKDGDGQKRVPGTPPDKKGSNMDSAKTHISMQFKLVFDKTNIQDAFYADKFTLSQTNIAKGAVTAGLKAAGKVNYSVQNEVEALTAIVRDNNKRLARFAWGDMVYEGVINCVSADYVMFNTNGEPCRAYVTISMILYDAAVAGANAKFWQDQYLKNIYSIKYGGEVPFYSDDFAEDLQNMFG